MGRSLNIVVVSIYSFPYGMAATNRIVAYSKGLVQNENSVTVVMPFPNNVPNREGLLPDEGIYKGISYKYTFGRYKSKIKLLRGISRIIRFRMIVGLVKSFFWLIKENKRKKIDVIILSADLIKLHFSYSLVARLINANIFFIFDEYPIPIRHKLKTSIPAWKTMMYKKSLKYFNGYISISQNLLDYYCSLVNHKSFVLSNIVDLSRFADLGVIEEDYLCYMGNMELAKDNVDVIINAFNIIKDEFINLQLFLYGLPKAPDRLVVETLIEKLGLQNRVIIKGYAENQNVPGILKRAKVLVSSQPNTLRASGGFPTKMGEYLATGVPSLFTDVGENAKYIKDSQETFFVQAHDVTAYANKLRFILNNYEFSKQVANRGRAFINNNYSTEAQGLRLKNFLIDTIDSK